VTAKHLLLVDDDAVFVKVLSRALSARGFSVITALDAAGALNAVREQAMQFAVVDLRIGRENGLSLIPELLEVQPGLRILLLTGYASIATAVEAIRRGAHDYLAKPVDADAVVRALLDEHPRDEHAREEREPESADENVPRLKRLEWEHIQRVLAECNGNVSEASRRLGLHRRTLQRKLTKRPIPESPVE
jgi:two-component system response regulator RegA